MPRISGFGRLTSAAILAGLLSGIGAIAFHALANRFGDTLILWAESRTWIDRLPIVLVVPTIGLLLVGIVLQRVPASRLGGVREVIEAIDHHGGFVPLIRLMNVVLSGLVLAFGGSVGPEGPMVQLGAVAGSSVGRTFGLTREQLRTVVRAGVAAGVAAAFRSPAGGVLLALEMFGARFDKDLPAIAIAACLGYVTRTALLGDAYPFQPTATMEPLPLAALLVVVPIMGLIGAPTGHLFIRMFERCATLFPRRWPLPLKVAFGGSLVGLIAVAFPQVLSAGYPVIDHVIREGMPVHLLLILLLLKMVATSITFGSGAVGGLFAPTLVMGALYGGAFGYGIHAVAPAVAPQPELFVLLGMVVMFGSIVKGYWSGLLLVADMSGCYHQLLLPGVIAGGLSFLSSWQMHDRSIFGLAIDPAARPAPAALAGG
ncbi:MAG TPA: chloride channel protein [Vicinamibacterales bacterium]|nr:chloride channel protein [Vicinamibacterales bacterium]